MVTNRELDSTTTITTYYSTIVYPHHPRRLDSHDCSYTGIEYWDHRYPPKTAPNHETNDHRNQAWIAGPVLGSLAGAALLLTTAILLSRRRRKANGRHDGGNDAADKPQLHSDCIPTPLPTELDDSETRPPVELPETRVTGGHHELPDLRNPLSADVAGQA
ncbi:hypothetical protein PG997_009439, partial [Apiospora hydei]